MSEERSGASPGGSPTRQQRLEPSTDSQRRWREAVKATLWRVPRSIRFAFFVTPHGFGHAARAAAIVEALGGLRPDWEAELWTSVPRWFFAESITVPFRYRAFDCDVGLVQKSPVEEDLPASLGALEEFWRAADRFRTREVAGSVRASDAAFVLCDISPFGLDVARAAGLPCVLIENFTWDWIYEPLAAASPVSPSGWRSCAPGSPSRTCISSSSRFAGPRRPRWWFRRLRGRSGQRHRRSSSGSESPPEMPWSW